MNSLVVFPEEMPQSTRIVLRGERARRVATTHGFTAGQRICVAVYGGNKLRAQVECFSEQAVELTVESKEASLSLRPIDLVVGLSRPQTTKKVIQAAVMSGVRSLHLVSSENGEKSYLDSHILKPENMRVEIAKALEQIWEGAVPDMRIYRSLRSFRERAMAALCEQGDSCRAIALPGAPLLDLSRHCSSSSSAVFVVGPEAGWSEREVRVFRDNAFTPIGLGPRVVRVEIAVAFLLGQSLSL